MDAEQEMWQMVRSATPADDEVGCVVVPKGHTLNVYPLPVAENGKQFVQMYGKSALKTVNGFMPVRCNNVIWYVCAAEVDVYALTEPTPYEQAAQE